MFFLMKLSMLKRHFTKSSLRGWSSLPDTFFGERGKREGEWGKRVGERGKREGERGKREGDSGERAGFRAVSWFVSQHSPGAASCPYLVASGCWQVPHFSGSL
jgi:hypothetical protein